MFDRATSLPYDRVLAIDFEYEVKDGNPPIPVCLVVKDLKDGSVARYWRDDLKHMKTPPFDTGGNTLIVAYYAPAEMLCFRVLGCSFAVQRGIKLCAPIHDALLIEAPIEHIDAEVERLKDCMTEASELVLGDGKICRVDADIIRYPDRFMDEGGSEMWQTVMNLLDNIES